MSHPPRRPFTRDEALRAGMRVGELYGPQHQRVFHGVYVTSGAGVSVLERARAALKVAPSGAYVSHQTAAILWGGWAPACSDTHISVPSGGHRSLRRGISAHRADPNVVALRHRGILMSPPAQVFLELAAARIELVDLVTVGDALVKAKRVTCEELIEAAAGSTRRGARLARRAAQLVRQAVDSPPESRLRLLIVLAGLPEPKVNHLLRGPGGEWVRRFELCYPELKLIIEYDGRHHRDADQWSRDLLRREQLERQGWRIIVVNADALFNDPRGTLNRIWTALKDRRAPGLPRRMAPAWERHFVRPNAS